MIEVGLTGGIGSGKSSVSERLALRGAGLVDADAIVHDLQSPGRPVFEAMVARWGSGILEPSGVLHRQAVADIVFNDADELEALSAIVNPAVIDEMARQREELKRMGGIVVLDIPLLAETEHPELGGIIVVDVPPELALQRLVEFRGFAEADVRARMANQVSREKRLEIADFVIDNSGDLEHLDAEVERCWAWLTSLS